MKEWRHRWRRNWCRNAVNDWVVTLLLTWFYFNLLFLCLFFSWFNSISFLFYFLWFNLKSFDSNMLYSPPCIFFFIVADTLSVRRSVGQFVRNHRVKKWENAHFRPCPPVRNWWPCIRPCFLLSHIFCCLTMSVSVCVCSFSILFLSFFSQFFFSFLFSIYLFLTLFIKPI